jgi:dTDP-4-amino-4,6-dideoxygalactose transaminase
VTYDESDRLQSPIPMSSPDIDEADVAAVTEVVRSGRLALGPQTERLEAQIAAYAGVRHAVAVSSGTAALHLAVRGLGLAEGDEVLVPSFTFAASVNVLLYERVRPVFVDVEPDTYNLDPADVERRISPRTRAIMAVDVFGHPAEWDALTDLAARHHLHLIDDSCEALGAEYRGKRLGRFGDVAAFAFYPNKQMTTGEGGVLVTDDQDLARLARSLRNQGRGEMGAWLEHERLGFNYRLDEMSAALGVSQLARLDAFLERRDRVAAAYGERLARIERVRAPIARPHVRMSWFVYVVTLAEGLDRDPVMRAIEERGIPVRGYFPPVHLQAYIRELLGSGPGLLPVTEAIARRTIALPFHNRLPEESIDRVVEALARALAAV